MSQVDNSSIASNPSTGPQGQEQAPTGKRKACILVVEDDRVAQKIFEKICTHSGHQTVLVSSLAEAREQLQKLILVDLIILDSQLGQDWGWQFLRELRNDALYQSLPVVVYTAHTERDRLLQYIELGVQAVRAKPIQGEIVNAEVEKALLRDWRGQMLLPPSTVCERLKVREKDYVGMLNTAALELERESAQLKDLLGSRNTTKIFEGLRQVRTQGNLCGVPAIEQVAGAIEKAIQQGELPRAIRGLQSLGLLITLLRQLSSSFKDSSALPLPTRAPTAAAPRLPNLSPSLPEAKAGAAAFGRKMASAPAWVMGKYFTRLRNIVVFKPEDIERITTEALTEAPFAAFLACAREVEEIPGRSSDDACAQIESLRNILPTLERLAEQLDRAPSDHSPAAVVAKLGLERSLIACQAARFASAGLVESPLSLTHLLLHSISCGLIASELGHFFRLENAHLLFAGGLLHDIGRWLLAVKEPGFYSLAIGLAQSQDTDQSMAERITFGISHDEAGLQFLSRAGHRRLFIDIAGYHGNPLSDAIARENRISTAIIHLANDLAYATASDDPVETELLVTRMSSGYHSTWKLLHDEGVELPLPPKDLVQTILPLASTCNWISMALASWASQSRGH